jgi:hypothetical protein
MFKTSDVLLSLILSSLIRHHLLLVFFDFRRRGFDSFIDDAFSDARSFSDLTLLVRDKESLPVPVSVEDGIVCSGSESCIRGAEVGAGPLDEEGIVSWEDSDRVEGEFSVGVDGTGEPRSTVLERLSAEIRGLCIAEGATDGAADGYGLAWRLYAPSVPSVAFVENGRGCT